MKLQDTLSGKIKELEDSGKIRIYLCGVTVYDESHIGHARTIIVFDVLRRYLESLGLNVEFIQNFTDVDDKIILRARRENIRASAISSRYIQHYFDDFDRLNVKRATKYPKATEHIQEMQDFIQILLKKNVAYKTKNGVYFEVSKFSEYCKLSKKNIGDLVVGARVEEDEEKRFGIDFALWKFADDDPSWESPWGRGRPGWHIECSTMAHKYLGDTLDIHGGGRDLIFPHHENEIAQSESYTGKPLAKIWMHVGMITINGEKMAKSKGNIKSVKYALDNWGPNIIRLFCLSGYYSKPIDYSEELLKENLAKWRQVELAYYEMTLAQEEGPTDYVEKLISECENEFNSAMNSDFNTHLALSAFFRFVKEINKLAAAEKLTKSIAKLALEPFQKMLDILGLKIPKITEAEVQSINDLIQQRESLRKQHQFQEADKIRDKIAKMNIELIDHKNRTTWIKKEKIKSDC